MLAALIALLGAGTVFATAYAVATHAGATRRYIVARAIAATAVPPAEPAPRDNGRILRQRNERIGSGVFRQLLGRSNRAARRAALLEQAQIPLKVSEYVLLVFVAAALGGLLAALASGFPLAGLAAAGAVVFAAEKLVRARARSRVRKFDQQLAVALQAMATSLKAGFGIMEAVGTVAREMDAPVSTEFRRILDEARVGGSFESGLQHLVERIDSADLRIVARAIELHKRVGGNLAEILEVVAATMREREELRGHVLALTAQQRLGGLIVGLLPVWVVAFFALTSPEFIAPLWESRAGNILLALGIGFEAIAFVMMQRILKIEV